MCNKPYGRVPQSTTIDMEDGRLSPAVHDVEVHNRIKSTHLTVNFYSHPPLSCLGPLEKFLTGSPCPDCHALFCAPAGQVVLKPNFYLDIFCAPNPSNVAPVSAEAALALYPTIKGPLRLASICPLSLSSCFFPAGILHSHQAAWLRGSPFMAAPILLYPALTSLLCGVCPRPLVWGNPHFQYSSPDISCILGLYPSWPITQSLGGKSVLPGAPSPMLDTDQGPGNTTD